MALAPNYAHSLAHAYKISKAGLNMVARQYGLSLEKEGFKVAAISPGVSNLFLFGLVKTG